MQYKCYRFAPCYLMLGLLMSAPMAIPGVLEVNGTCYVANVSTACPAVDSVSDPSVGDSGPSSTGIVAFNFNIIFSDGDLYDIAGAYSASYTHAGGSRISVDPTVTYAGILPSAGADDITLDVYQNFYDNSTPGVPWSGIYSATVPLSLTTAGAASGELFFDHEGVGRVSLSGPGSITGTPSTYLNLNSDSTLSADFRFSFNFDAGALPGTSASAVAPEPGMAIPCGLGLLLLTYGLRREKNEDL